MRSRTTKRSNLREVRKHIAVGCRYREISPDTPVESYQRVLGNKTPSKYWSQTMRWDRENSQILFDSNERLKSLLDEKLIYPDREQRKLMKLHQEELEFFFKFDIETWWKRGGLVNVSDMLLRGTEHLILWIYAKNKKFQPYTPKWLFYHLENGLVPETKYFQIIKKPYLEPVKKISDARKIRE